MLQYILLAGIALRPIALPEPVLDVRVVDLDADGKEDLVALTEKRLYLFRSGRGEPVVHAAPPLTVVGRGRLGIVRDGRYRAIRDPFAATWEEGEPGGGSLLASFGRGKPALLDSPGDLDGDGRDDAVLADERGFHYPGGRIGFVHEADLQIAGNEAFAVEYRIPVPIVGNWTGHERELVFVTDKNVHAYRAGQAVGELDLERLVGAPEDPTRIRRHQVLLRDVNGNGRLDLVVVLAQGSTSVFAQFDAFAMVFLDGRVYDSKKKGFYRPTSYPKVEGALLKPDLVDLDSDGDLDLVLSTVDTNLLAAARGTAPGTYYLFRFDKGRYRKPTWIYRGDVPLSAFTAKPRPPATFLPDYDDDARPEVLVLEAGVRVAEVDEDGQFRQVARNLFEHRGKAVRGRTFAAVPGASGVLIVERGR